MTDQEEKNGVDFDLQELYAKVRPSLPIAVIIGILCGGVAYFYAQSLEKKYQAVAQFAIDGGASGLPDLSGAFGSFAPQMGANETSLVSEKIMSRDFIIELMHKANLDQDPYFTDVDRSMGILPGLVGSTLRSETPPVTRTIANVVDVYRETVGVNVARNSSVISVQVLHPNPVRASELANLIVETHIENLEERQRIANQQKFDHTARRLKEAQKNLDDAQEAARLYAVENSVRSKQDLGASSLSLDRFRREFKRLNMVLDGIDYLQQQSEKSSLGTINAQEFYAEHLVAFSPLQREFGWTNDMDELPIPSSGQLARLQKTLSDERDQLGRTLGVMAAEAARNAEAAGRLAALERDIEVHKAIYSGLVTQTEARALVVELQGVKVQRIQKATPPISPSSPRTVRLVLVVFLLGTVVAILISLFRIRRKGTLYTDKKIEEALGSPALAENIERAVGGRPQSINALMKRSTCLRNAALIDMIIMMRDDKVRQLSIIGVPSSVVVENLATIVGPGIADKGETVAVINLTKHNKDANEATLRSYGVFLERISLDGVNILDWVERPSGDTEAMSLDDALDHVKKLNDRIVIACAHFRHGTSKNKLALKSTDYALLVAQRGRVTQQDINWVKRLLPSHSTARVDFVSA